MKKTFIIIIFICLIYFIIGKTTTTYTIPDEAIRIRIIPDTNESVDQKMKETVKDDVEYTLYNLLKDTKNIDEARTIINENIPLLENRIDNIFKRNSYDKTYKINYGLNYFPEKEYKGVKYDSGDYESLYITIGSGTGDNWWCVLFPPICLIEAEESTDVEYRLFIEDLFNKYLSIK